MEELKEKINLTLKKRFKTLNNNFQEKMGPPEIPEWDSLEHLNLITELNKIFNINGIIDPLESTREELASMDYDVYKNFDDYGEKIHETLLSEDEFENIIEFKKYFTIVPKTGSFSKKLDLFYKNINNEIGKKIQNSFSYSSKNNRDFLDISGIKKLLKF